MMNGSFSFSSVPVLSWLEILLQKSLEIGSETTARKAEGYFIFVIL